MLHNRLFCSAVIRISIFTAILFSCCQPDAIAQKATISGSGSATSNLVTAPVYPGQTIRLSGHMPAWAQSSVDRGSIADGTLLQHLSILLAQTPQRKAALQKFLRDQQDPSSPEYHHWIEPEEFGTRFGASQHDIAAVSQWLTSQGLTVERVSKSSRLIYFSGTADTVGMALGVEFHTYRVPVSTAPPGVMATEDRISIASEPTVPSALAPVVESIGGLYSVFARPMSHMRKEVFTPRNAGALPQVTVVAGSTYFIAPEDFDTIYDINALYNNDNVTGAGQTIAILGRSRVCAQDVTQFQSLTGINFNMPTVVIPTGGIDPGAAVCTAPPNLATGDQGEQTLDVTRAGSIAIGANLDLIVSADSKTVDGAQVALEYAINSHSTLHDNIISMSYGSCESDAGAAYTQQLDQLYQTAAAAGISIFISSGDSGAAGCATPFSAPVQADLLLNVNGLASSGYVTSVGGTEFNDASDYSQYWSNNNSRPTLYSALSYIPEGAWNEPTIVNGSSQTVRQIAGSGGGVSQYIPTPSWQTGTGVPGTQGRYQPDIAFTASGHDAYLLCEAAAGGSCVPNSQGQVPFLAAAGTSASAPDMAGIAALLDQEMNGAQGNLNPQLYPLAASTTNIFHDITLASSGIATCSLDTPSMCNNSDPGPGGLTVTGSNGLAGYQIGPGYDEVTGLGSLDVANFVNALGGTKIIPEISLGASPASITTAETVIIFAAVGYGTPATGTVQFLSNGTSLGTPVTIINEIATSPAESFPIAGTYSITAQYFGDSTYDPVVSSAISLTVTSPAPPTFTLSAADLTISSPGQTTANTSTITATGQNGFSGTVALTCTVIYTGTGTANDPPTCTLNNNDSVALSSSTTNGTVTATIHTTAASTAALTAPAHAPGRLWNAGSGAILACVLLLPFGVRRRNFFRQSLRKSALLSLLFLGIVTAMMGCGGGSSNPAPIKPTNPGTSTGAYIVLVAGTSGSTTKQATFTLTVN